MKDTTTSNQLRKEATMIPDDESMIRTKPRPALPPADPATLRALEALPFRPFTAEW